MSTLITLTQTELQLIITSMSQRLRKMKKESGERRLLAALYERLAFEQIALERRAAGQEEGEHYA